VSRNADLGTILRKIESAHELDDEFASNFFPMSIAGAEKGSV